MIIRKPLFQKLLYWWLRPGGGGRLADIHECFNWFDLIYNVINLPCITSKSKWHHENAFWITYSPSLLCIRTIIIIIIVAIMNRKDTIKTAWHSRVLDVCLSIDTIFIFRFEFTFNFDLHLRCWQHCGASCQHYDSRRWTKFDQKLENTIWRVSAEYFTLNISPWPLQFVNLFLCNENVPKLFYPSNTIFNCHTRAMVIQGEEDDEGNTEPLSIMDFVLHFLTFFWKVLFAFIPPR